MDTSSENSSDKSRALLFGLLVNCIFSSSTQEVCLLWELRNTLSVDEKHAYVMGLRDDEISGILAQHEECYKKRLSDLMRS